MNRKTLKITHFKSPKDLKTYFAKGYQHSHVHHIQIPDSLNADVLPVETCKKVLLKKKVHNITLQTSLKELKNFQRAFQASKNRHLRGIYLSANFPIRKIYKILFKSLKDFKNLSNVHVIQKCEVATTTDSIQGLKRSLIALPRLKRLTLKVMTKNGREQMHLNQLFDRFKVFKELTYIDLDVDKFQLSFKQFLPRFLKAMTLINKLQTLKLNLGNTIRIDDILPETLSDSFTYFQGLKNLTNLSIALLQKAYGNKFFTQLRLLPKLQGLELSLKAPSTNELEALIDTLNSLQPLSKACLSFNHHAREETNLSIDMFNGLCKALSKHSKTLESLALRVPNFKDHDLNSQSNRFIELSSLLLSCRNLNKLSLFFTKTFNAQELIDLAKALSHPEMTKLKSLALNLEGGLETVIDTPTFFGLLGKTLANNNNLRELGILLKGMQYARDEEIKKLFGRFSSLKKLRKLWLQFDNFLRISNKSLEFLVELADDSKSLEEATFSFVGKAFGSCTFTTQTQIIKVLSDKPISGPFV